MEKLNLIWKNIYESVVIDEEQKLTFELMMSDTNLEKIDEENKLMIITTKNKIDEVIIKSDFYNYILEALNINYKDFKLKIFYHDEYKKNNKDINIMVETIDNYEPNERFTFNNFIASKDNELLYKAALTISKNRSKSWNPFFIHGKSGLGKTHLLHAIGNNAKEQKTYKSIKYIEAKDFGNIVVKAMTDNDSNDKTINKRLEEIKSEFLSYDLLLIDDIQFIQSRKKTKEIFFYIFDSFIKSDKRKKQIVVTSDQEPEDLINFEERFITRFKKGLLLSIAPPDKETAIEILKVKIRSLEGLNEGKISDDAIEWIAVNFGKNVRFLEGALNKLLLFSINADNDKFEVKLNDVINIFKEANSINKHITKENIIFIVSKYFGISKSDLLGATRKKEIVAARNISIYLIRELMNDSLIEIGRFFKRDHSTIIVALKKTKDNLNRDINLNDTVQEIKKML